MKKIVVLGSSNTDMVISGKKIPAPGETVSGGRFMMNPGGKGANQAVAVARLSAKKGTCAFIAKVGDDLFGRDTAARLMQLETPIETVLTAAKWAHAKGVIVILNPAPAARLPRELYALLDWITPNVGLTPRPRFRTAGNLL